MKGGSANRMAVKKSKKKSGANIQQAAGLIRYFDEESEDAIQISKGALYFACISVSMTCERVINPVSPEIHVLPT